MNNTEDSEQPEWIIRFGAVDGSFKSIEIHGEKLVREYLEQRELKARLNELELFADGKLKPITMYSYAKDRYSELNAQLNQKEE